MAFSEGLHPRQAGGRFGNNGGRKSTAKNSTGVSPAQAKYNAALKKMIAQQKTLQSKQSQRNAINKMPKGAAKKAAENRLSAQNKANAHNNLVNTSKKTMSIVTGHKTVNAQNRVQFIGRGGDSPAINKELNTHQKSVTLTKKVSTVAAKRAQLRLKNGG